MCFVKIVVVFLEVCCLFGYKLLFNVLCEKNAEPHGLFFFFFHGGKSILILFLLFQDLKTMNRKAVWAGTLLQMKLRVYRGVMLCNCDRVVELLLVFWFPKYTINIVYIKVSLVTLSKRQFKMSIVCSLYIILFNEFLK